MVVLNSKMVALVESDSKRLGMSLQRRLVFLCSDKKKKRKKEHFSFSIVLIFNRFNLGFNNIAFTCGNDASPMETLEHKHRLFTFSKMKYCLTPAAAARSTDVSVSGGHGSHENATNAWACMILKN